MKLIATKFSILLDSCYLRQKKSYLFNLTSKIFLGTVGRQNFFSLYFFYRTIINQL